MMVKTRIELLKGDITKIDAEVIVNAANNTLLGGGGVDGAIHRAAGHELLEECRTLNGCPTGDARITGGYNLKARKVIHTVGPVWHGGYNNEHELLASCYHTSLELAKSNNLKTIAFPAISTGVYRFPKEIAASIALYETTRFLEQNEIPEKVIFVLFDDENFELYRKLIDK